MSVFVPHIDITSEVETYTRCDQICFEYEYTVYKLVATLCWTHLHFINIDYSETPLILLPKNDIKMIK